MNEDYEPIAGPDDAGEETYVDSIGMLELLGRPGKTYEIPIFPGKEIRFGRDGDKCLCVLPEDTVSKQHFRVYSIIYEKDKLYEFPPLIYCEDLESTNGTYVNDVCIGIICRERVGHLLSDGDIIEIKPNVCFRFHQPIYQPEFRSKDQFHDIERFKDRFDVSDRALGQGSYGVVYLAKEVATSRQMACKIIDIDAAAHKLTEVSESDIDGEEWHERIRRINRGKELVMREIRILSKLSHPHLVNLKKAFISSSSLYMLTDLAPGGDLFSYIDYHGGLLNDWHSRVIARQIVLAIQFMHSKSIVHRDIKPENVLVMQTDFGGRVVLTDFGFANYANQRRGRLFSRVGTTGFIAPEIEYIDEEKGGYTKAADLWSLGILTATLLTGSSVVPREELTQISQAQIVERLFGTDPDTSARWQNLPSRALSFLRGLLVLNPDKRLTATEALNHSWFKKPLSEAALLEERYEKVIRFWRSRDDDKVIENLPGKIMVSQDDQVVKSAPKSRRKIPDTTLSPYFGLDRHLLPKLPSKRKTILETLNESGSPFLPAQPQKKNEIAITAAGRLEDASVLTVKGIDLFGTTLSSEDTSQPEFDLEVCLVPTTPVIPHSERTFGFDMSDPTKPLSSPAEATGRELRESGVEVEKRKRPRRESEDLEEKRIRDGVAKELPRYSTAKALKDAVDKKKEEMKGKHQLEVLISEALCQRFE